MFTLLYFTDKQGYIQANATKTVAHTYFASITDAHLTIIKRLHFRVYIT